MIRVTLDSNVHLSALVFGGKPKRIVEIAIEGRIEVAVSDAIIEEVHRHLTGKFGWSEARANDATREVLACSRHITPTETIDAVPLDPDDNRILECAVAAESEVIVTGDSDLLGLGSFRGITIENAADFLARFESRAR